MLNSLYKISSDFNKTTQCEQFKLIKYDKFYKMKVNLFLKNRDKNKFIFITNLLLLERAANQRVVFIKETVDCPRVKPLKIGCSVKLRNGNLLNFWNMLILTSFPKLNELIKMKNTKLDKQHLLFATVNKFLFLSVFSFFIDFDKFLMDYEDLSYLLNLEFYSRSHEFLLNRISFSYNGLQSI